MKYFLIMFFLCAAGWLFQGSAAEPTAADLKRFQETKAKAEKGDAEAQSNLGLMYAFGRGVAKDDAESVKWYRKAAEQGLALAQSSLGFMYANGQGAPKDLSMAYKWFRKAAEQGDAAAQNNLGFMHINGQGVPKDEVMAYKWFLLAGAQGDKNAKESIPKIKRGLTASQQAEGERLAREWKPQGNKP